MRARFDCIVALYKSYSDFKSLFSAEEFKRRTFCSVILPVFLLVSKCFVRVILKKHYSSKLENNACNFFADFLQLLWWQLSLCAGHLSMLNDFLLSSIVTGHRCYLIYKARSSIYQVSIKHFWSFSQWTLHLKIVWPSFYQLMWLFRVLCPFQNYNNYRSYFRSQFTQLVFLDILPVITIFFTSARLFILQDLFKIR